MKSKRACSTGILVLAAILLAPQIIQAQGTTYLSNLGLTPTGSNPVGSDSWLAAEFQTGNNLSGYTLNSIDLEMADASGTPDGFTVMIYSTFPGAGIPKSSIGTLNGSANPSTIGIYTYTPATSLTLSQYTVYFVVLTAATPVADGAYNWSNSGAYTYNPNGGWLTVEKGWTSSDGSSWNGSTTFYPQFAITATPVPEPSAETFLGFGRCRKS
jgi:hypothetical protein